MPSGAEAVAAEFSPDPTPALADAAMLKQRSVRGAIATFGSQGLRFVLQFGSQVALAHFLAPAAFGVVAMAGPVLNLIQIFNELGLSQATVQKPQLSSAESSGLFWTNLAISAALGGLVALLAQPVAGFYQEPKLAPVLAVCGMLLLLSGVSAQPVALLNRHMRFSALAAMDIACAGVAAATGLIAAWRGCGYWSLVLMQLGNALTACGLAWSLTGFRPCAPWRAARVGELLRFGGHLTGFNLLGYAENNLASILLGRFAGSAALGLFDRGNKLVSVPWWQLNLPISRVAVSLLCRVAGEPARYRQACRSLLGAMLLIAAPGLLWVALTARELVPLLLGPAWHSAAPIVAWLAIATIPGPFGIAAYWLFVSQGRVRAQLHYGVLSAAGVVLAVLIGLAGGPVGVAIAWAAFSPYIQGVQLFGATRKGAVCLRDLLAATSPILCGLATVAASGLFLRVHPVFTLPAAAALPTELLLAYAGTLAVMLLFPEGRRLLRSFWQMRTTLRQNHNARSELLETIPL